MISVFQMLPIQIRKSLPSWIASLAVFGMVGLMYDSAAHAQSGTKRMTTRSAPTRTTTNAIAAKPKGIAVVELFTSQGCSSCPPADTVLQQVKSVAEKGNYPVYVLSFHVDYWNRLGWTDPYSSEEFTQRQRAYASASGSNRVYTPQMVVNGTREFVGSKKDMANTAIVASLKQPSSVDVKLKNVKSPTGNTLVIDYEVRGAKPGQMINVALVESPQANKVPRGENGGRTLRHVNVVRSFKTVALKQTSGKVELELPADVNAKNVKVIGYVQNARDRKIVGAGAITL